MQPSTNMKSATLRSQLLLTLCGLLFPMLCLHAQQEDHRPTPEKKEKVQVGISGYMQGLAVVAQKNATPSVGTATSEREGMFMRMGLRRGYLKTKATYKALTAVTQLRATDKAIGVFNAYLRYSPSFLSGHHFTLGLCTTPFGYELGVSSSKRETFERAAYYSDLFPGDVDMGLFYLYSPHLASNFHINHLALDVALLSGNGTYGMRKPLPDAIARLVFGHKSASMDRLYGVNAYYGYATALGGQRARRLYLGAYLDYQLHFVHGDLKLRMEAIGGWQAGTPESNCAIGSNSPEKKGVERFVLVERPFFGAMGMLLFKSKQLPVEGFCKYDYYNRNLDLQKRLSSPAAHKSLRYEAEGVSHKGTFGVNAYFFENRLRLSAHYELNAQKGGYFENPNDDLSPLLTFWIPQNDLFLLGAQFSF